jgi:hypothetical protein
MSDEEDFWREAEDQMRARPGADVVQLSGGPMDGTSVPPDAPALWPNWYKTWPATIAAKHRPGYYEVTGKDEVGTTVARWREP